MIGGMGGGRKGRVGVGIDRVSRLLPRHCAWGSLVLVGPEFGDHAEVFERGGVLDFFGARRDVAQQAPHDLAAAGFGQSVREADDVGPGQRADLFGDVGPEFLLEGIIGGPARGVLEGDERADAGPFDLVRHPHHRRLRDRGVRDQGRLHLHRAEPVARHIDDVVDAP